MVFSCLKTFSEPKSEAQGKTTEILQFIAIDLAINHFYQWLCVVLGHDLSIMSSTTLCQGSRIRNQLNNNNKAFDNKRINHHMCMSIHV